MIEPRLIKELRPRGRRRKRRRWQSAWQVRSRSSRRRWNDKQ